ncbi:MAG: hypothetical protein ABSG53_15970 [Thermoguttaceae bacterium]|jgi:hypothetical protein
MATTPNTPQQQQETHQTFEALKPGDRVEVAHVVTIGPRSWTTKSVGTVVQTERGRHGLHFRRNFDDKVFSDFIVLRREDGELTTVALDEFTILRRL